MYQWCINNNKAELIVVTWRIPEFMVSFLCFNWFSLSAQQLLSILPHLLSLVCFYIHFSLKQLTDKQSVFISIKVIFSSFWLTAVKPHNAGIALEMGIFILMGLCDSANQRDLIVCRFELLGFYFTQSPCVGVLLWSLANFNTHCIINWKINFTVSFFQLKIKRKLPQDLNCFFPFLFWKSSLLVFHWKCHEFKSCRTAGGLNLVCGELSCCR